MPACTSQEAIKDSHFYHESTEKSFFFKFVPVWRDDLTGGTGIYWTKKGPAFELAKGGIGQ